MGLFSISDLVISITLFLNAVALLATSPKKLLTNRNSSISLNNNDNTTSGKVSNSLGETTADESMIPLKSGDLESPSLDDQQEPDQTSIQQRFELLVDSIRRASGVIVIWNILYAILLVVVFRG